MGYSIRPTIPGRRRRPDIKEQMSGSDPELMREFDRQSNLSHLTPGAGVQPPKKSGFNIFDVGLNLPQEDLGPIKAKIKDRQRRVGAIRGMKVLKRVYGE